ncbi:MULTISPECIES: type-F conjugative transfer system protein TrbI [Rahnella]|uniref:Type-F conjugative transfer system protein TrbI n=1 Tax=Rahnella laticis TaxID=2787622 RepID=A0ABS0EAJ3_9GAMM|nr:MULTISPECIES: type-F conjugative transfer system protein TrbI [Rahnella]MBF7982103.1 type-F conjugative transfer system protein TrbI [Rahnella laticis]MBF8002193.1 type-F conjugative transfer system protein TrbI [Rahnella sp. LAC-M12]
MTPDTLTPSDHQSVTVKKRSKRRNRCIVPVAVVAAGMIALNAAIALLLIQWQTPVTVTFDMKGTVDQFMTQTAQHQLTQGESDALTLRFTTALDASLKDYQHRHDALILVAPSVVSGVKDITVDIQRDVARRMRADKDAR